MEQSAMAQRETEQRATDQSAVDPVTREIIGNRLNSITQEMALNLVRTAYSVLFAEDRDFSCVIFDHNALQIGVASFVPVHQGGTVGSMSYLLKKWGLEGLEDGDVVMHNDPLNEGSHIPDITLFKPVYYDNTPVAIPCSVAHHNDTGGMRPSSYCPDADEIYQEGIRFPGVKLFKKGELQKDILDIYMTNVREGDREKGDLYAQLSTFAIAERGIKGLCEKYGVEQIKMYFDAIQQHAEWRMRKSIRENLREGTFEGESYQDHDGWEEKSWKIKVAVTVKHDPEPTLTFDFAGTDKQAKGFVNAYYQTTKSFAWSASWAMVDPYVHRCHGTTKPIEVVAPEGTIVNAILPAPCGAETTEAGMAAEDACVSALGKARPENATGTWVGTFGCHFIWGSNPRRLRHPRLLPQWSSLFADAGSGGGGGRATMDAIGPTTAFPAGGPITIPNVEIMESNFPILYVHRKIYQDGGGAGKFRGSPGLEVLVKPESEVYFTSLSNKGYHGPQGFGGGKSGATWELEIRDPNTDTTIKRLPPKVVGQYTAPTEAIYVRTPGGGGYGNPLERDPERVREDVLEGYVSVKGAMADYGVVINPKTFEIEHDATEKLRKKG